MAGANGAVYRRTPTKVLLIFLYVYVVKVGRIMHYRDFRKSKP